MPTTSSITLCEEIILLTISDEGLVLRWSGDTSVRAAVAGACLVDLSFLGRIDNDLTSLFVVDDTPTGEAHLDKMLATLGGKGQAVELQQAVTSAYNISPSLYEMAMQRLIERKILEPKQETFLWVMKSRRYPPMSNIIQAEAKQKIFNILTGNDIPDPEEVALVSLAHESNILELFMSQKEIDRLVGRISDIANLDLTIQMTLKISGAIKGQMAMLMAGVPF